MGVAFALLGAANLLTLHTVILISTVVWFIAFQIASLIVAGHFVKHGVELLAGVHEHHVVITPLVHAGVNFSAGVIAESVHAESGETVLLSAIHWSVAVTEIFAIWLIHPLPEFVARAIFWAVWS